LDGFAKVCFGYIQVIANGRKTFHKQNESF